MKHSNNRILVIEFSDDEIIDLINDEIEEDLKRMDWYD